MDLSIIILNYKTKGLVKQCLKGIKLLNLNLSYEIIVVDNNSQDGVEEMVKEQFSEVKMIVNKSNTGYAAGNNLGIKKSQGKYVMILNPDVVVLEGAIESMYQFLEKNKSIAILGPKLIHPDGTVQYSCYRFPKIITPLYRRTFLGKLPKGREHLRHYLMMDYDHQSDREVDWLLGACLMVKREAIEKIGLMDERFFLYFEDVDWCRRFFEAGYKVYYFPQAEMVHYHQRLSAENRGFMSIFSKATRIHIMSGIRYFSKWFRIK